MFGLKFVIIYLIDKTNMIFILIFQLTFCRNNVKPIRSAKLTKEGINAKPEIFIRTCRLIDHRETELKRKRNMMKKTS